MGNTSTHTNGGPFSSLSSSVFEASMRLQEVNGLPVAPAKASGATEGFIRRQTVGPGWVDLPFFRSKVFALADIGFFGSTYFDFFSNSTL